MSGHELYVGDRAGGYVRISAEKLELVLGGEVVATAAGVRAGAVVRAVTTGEMVTVFVDDALVIAWRR